MKKLMVLILMGLTPLLLAYDCGNGLLEGVVGNEVDQWYDPVWSLDGGWIIFSYDGSIYRIRSDGSGLRSLSPHEAKDYPLEIETSPNISPDGSRIVFVTSRHGNDLEIGSSNLDGSDYRRLTKNKFTENSPVWSPDGSRIAFVGTCHDAKNIKIQKEEEEYEQDGNSICTMAADGSDPIQVTDPSVNAHTAPPVWSPNSKRIAFVGIELATKRALYTIGVDGSDLRRIGETDVNLAASPDGSRIAFAGDAIYTANWDGSDLQKIWDPDSFAAEYFLWGISSWSPDGSEIRFEAKKANNTEILAVRADGSGSRAIVELNGTTYGGSWTRDGSRMALLQSSLNRFPQRQERFIEELYTLNEDGSELRPLALGLMDGLVIAHPDR